MIDPKVPPDDSMSDEKLIEYVNNPNVPISLQSKARAILHKRKNSKDNFMIGLTVLIFILTAYLAYREFTKEPANITATIPASENGINVSKPTNKTETPNNNRSTGTHGSASRKPK